MMRVCLYAISSVKVLPHHSLGCTYCVGHLQYKVVGRMLKHSLLCVRDDGVTQGSEWPQFSGEGMFASGAILDCTSKPLSLESYGGVV